MSMQRLLSFEIGDERGSEELQAPCDASHGFDVLVRRRLADRLAFGAPFTRSFI